MTQNRLSVLLSLLLGVVVGCTSGIGGRLGDRLFPRPEITSYETPKKRIAEVEGLAARATGKDTPEQQELVAQLARRIQTEPDPLVRRSIVKAVGGFQTPLANQVLIAGSSDADAGVRSACCQGLAGRTSPEAVARLGELVRADENFDVRVAAVRALGESGGSDAPKALLAALEDRDPAMQLVAMESMRSATGRDLGQDVNAYVALARGETPQPPARESAVARTLKEWSPF
ncbi:HEAT repeat protein [Pirellulimonas nuda]|uniref:HEAT repeat protein n=1 Tax=Pirellulimonas nuda TaxID=2528009 RepID=A0A518DJX0_9BACT|nr:HEAT repeat domain-containing protein [Pirellulimonas nuda]QDU91769.1 HEAT repeat protein [Pirellulimonas nuda]